MANKRIGKQIVLPLSKAFRISLRSIQTRFFRSMITMAGVILAIAFLMSCWTNDIVTRSLRGSGNPEVDVLLQLSGEETDPSAVEAGNARLTWIISLSLLVCVAGVLNSMLMAVTERFQEIGTMKCLGALDPFIVKIFLLESLLLGSIGSVLGLLVGLVLSLIGLSVGFGRYVWQYFPLADVMYYALYSFLIGTTLSVLGAIYPAWTAARMEPVEAMRVER